VVTRDLNAAQARLVTAGTARLGAISGRLQALSPLATLARGFAVCQLLDGTIVRRTDQLSPGSGVRFRLAKGEATARVTGVEGEQA
jgi:exodeoxyribonuclease VII large subunit